MVYYVFIADTPYCGTERVDFQAFESPLPEAELNCIVEEMVQLNAEGYEYLVTGWNDDEFEDEDERAQALENYYADCFGKYIEITKEQYENEEYED